MRNVHRRASSQRAWTGRARRRWVGRPGGASARRTASRRTVSIASNAVRLPRGPGQPLPEFERERTQDVRHLSLRSEQDDLPQSNPIRPALRSAPAVGWSGAFVGASCGKLRTTDSRDRWSAAVKVVIRVQVYKKAFRRRGVWIDSVRWHKAGRVYHIIARPY